MATVVSSGWPAGIMLAMNLAFSVSYAGFWGQDRLAWTNFAARGAAGYSAVMLMGKRPHLSPLDATPERLGLQQLLKTSGMRRHRRPPISQEDHNRRFP